MPEMRVSYKPQKLGATYEGTVQELLHARIRHALVHPQVTGGV